MPQAVGGNVEGAIRKVLSHSHIAAIAIAVLLLRSLDLGFRAFGRPLLLVVDFLFDLLALRGIPYGKFTLGQWLTLIPTLGYVLGAFACLLAAWLVARWVYGVNPFRSLSNFRRAVVGRGDA